jgi:hypothetical protein
VLALLVGKVSCSSGGTAKVTAMVSRVSACARDGQRMEFAHDLVPLFWDIERGFSAP